MANTTLAPQHTSLEHLKQAAYSLLRAEAVYREEHGFETSSKDAVFAFITAAASVAIRALDVMEATA